MPYIIQKLKMWGCNAMTADNVSSLIGCDEYSNVSLKGIPCTEIRTNFKNKFKKFNQNKAKNLPKVPKTSISRIDT